MRPSRPVFSAGVWFGLLAAVSFGAGAPFAQRLVAHADPQLLAGLLYLGAVIVLGLARPSGRRGEARLRRSDAPTLGVVVLSGGVLGPVLLLIGLERVSGVTGSLVLNLEAPLTALLAVWVFGEHMSRRAWSGGLIVVIGAAVLGLGAGAADGGLVGVVLIAAACACWAIDNNLTQRLTLRDPVAIVRVKAAGAAAVNLVIAVARGAALPTGWVLVAALVLGAVSYGLSVLFDAYALRLLGAARESALFATAPFAGALVAVGVLGEPVTARVALAVVLMALGTVALLTDRHAHEHEHPAVAHEHRHAHDEHHQHDHGEDTDVREPHSHWHEHAPITHRHGHVSDVHHRHPHRRI